MSANVSSKKKLIIAVTVIGVVLLAAIVSVVAVLAAGQQAVTSQVSVTYSVTDVSATVSARYKVKGAAVVTPDNNEITFTADQQTTTGAINFTDNDDSTTNTPATIGLSSTGDYVIFEYKFDNNSSKAFNVYLTAVPTADNMTLTIATSATEVADMEEGLDFTAIDTVQTPTADNATTSVAGGADSVSYVYIKAKINNLNASASLAGAFGWTLDSALAG